MLEQPNAMPPPKWCAPGRAQNGAMLSGTHHFCRGPEGHYHRSGVSPGRSGVPPGGALIFVGGNAAENASRGSTPEKELEGTPPSSVVNHIDARSPELVMSASGYVW